jgi:hypothetical protein
MPIDLSGPRAKMERAYEHRDTLEREIRPVLDGESHQIESSAEFQPDLGYYIFRVAKMPDEWRVRVAILLGDLVHCLRSALDQLAWQLVLNHSGRPKLPKYKTAINFPIQYHRKGLKNTYTFSKIAAGDRTILDRAQPYSGTGNPKLHGLAIIQQLSNRDKHRVLNPILVLSKTFTVRREDSTSVFFDVFSFELRAREKNLKIGTEIVWCRLARHADDKMEVTGYTTPQIRLPQRSDISLMDGVDVMIRTVEDILGGFAAEHSV